MSEIPKCCGRKMEISIETSRFIELQCKECGDIIYVKKEDTDQKPVMLDD
jgi:DNA-directed RNA polymerase subunit RPC12/RpoP